jgi:hypothetical protein
VVYPKPGEEIGGGLEEFNFHDRCERKQCNAERDIGKPVDFLASLRALGGREFGPCLNAC